VALPPGTPTLSASTTSSNTGAYSLSWSTPATTTSFVLQQQVSGGAWTTVQSSAATTWSVSGEGNATYGYRVQACYQGICGGWSSTVNVTVLLLPSSWPTISGAGISSNGAFTLTRTTVPTATNYAVYYIASSTNWVQVQDGGGCAPTNTAVTETVVFPPTTAPTLNVNRPNINSDTLVATWSAVSGATYYTLDRSSNGTTYTEIFQENGVTTVNDAPGSGTFYYEVQACNAGGCGPWSAAFKIFDVVK
jgi:hypothetical protein